MRVCVCVCVCVRARARVRLCVCVCVCVDRFSGFQAECPHCFNAQPFSHETSGMQNIQHVQNKLSRVLLGVIRFHANGSLSFSPSCMRAHFSASSASCFSLLMIRCSPSAALMIHFASLFVLLKKKKNQPTTTRFSPM